MRLVTAYFPYSGYSDTQVQQVYASLDILDDDAIKYKQHFMVGAGCDARVGERTDNDDNRTLGQYGLLGSNL